VPASPWLDNKAPAAPAFTATPSGKEVSLQWTHPATSDVFHYVVYYTYGGNWNYVILNKDARSYVIKPPSGQVTTQIVVTKVAVTAVDRTGNESAIEIKTIN
jgi:hypothetical protein